MGAGLIISHVYNPFVMLIKITSFPPSSITFILAVYGLLKTANLDNRKDTINW